MMLRLMRPFAFPRWRLARIGGRAVGVYLIAMLAQADVDAVVTFTNTSVNTNGRQVILRVGSTGPTIDTVEFNVTGSKAYTATPTVASSGGVLVELTGKLDYSSNFFGSNPDDLYLRVTSPADLTCLTPATCGAQTIPFTTIGWTANLASADDIAAGSFTGAADQELFHTASGGSSFFFFGSGNDGEYKLTNTLTFSFTPPANVIYPAGSYTGRVTFTGVVL